MNYLNIFPNILRRSFRGRLSIMFDRSYANVTRYGISCIGYNLQKSNGSFNDWGGTLFPLFA